MVVEAFAGSVRGRTCVLMVSVSVNQHASEKSVGAMDAAGFVGCALDKSSA